MTKSKKLFDNDRCIAILSLIIGISVLGFLAAGAVGATPTDVDEDSNDAIADAGCGAEAVADVDTCTPASVALIGCTGGPVTCGAGVAVTA